MIRLRVIAIGGAMFLRSIFMLILAAQAYQFLPKAETAIFFQILFFQAVVIAFLSASGFFRAQSLDKDEDAIVYLSAMLLLIAPSILLPMALLVMGAGYANYGVELAIIWAGAVAASLGAPLSGYVMRKRGPFRAFIPSAIASIIAGALLFGVGPWSRWLPYALLATLQISAFVLLAAQSPHLLTGACMALWRDGIKPTYSRMREGAVVGIVNVANLAVIFTLRHKWELRADVEIVAAVFLVLRFSDTGLQLLNMVLSGHIFLERIFRSTIMLWSFAIIAIVSLIVLFGVSRLAVPPLIFALLAQFAIDLLRYPGSLGFLYQMKVFRLRYYARFLLVSPMIATLLVGPLIFTGHPLAIYVMIVTTTLVSVALTARDARS